MSDYLDLRELAQELEDLRNQVSEHLAEPTIIPALDDDERERLEALEALDKEFGGLWDKAHDEPTAIPEFAWKDYAQELADDLGIVDADSAIYPYVDWDAWADELESDYITFEFEGRTYYVRG